MLLWNWNYRKNDGVFRMNTEAGRSVCEVIDKFLQLFFMLRGIPNTRFQKRKIKCIYVIAK